MNAPRLHRSRVVVMNVEEFFKKHEGFKRYPYTCTAGKITIGWGWNLTDNGLPVDICEILLERTLQIATEDSKTVLGEDVYNRLSEVRKAILVDLAANLGLGRLRKFKNMIAAVKVGDYAKASLELIDSRWYTQVGIRGKDLAEAMVNNIWPERFLEDDNGN